MTPSTYARNSAGTEFRQYSAPDQLLFSNPTNELLMLSSHISAPVFFEAATP
jgi:hypothetical protein